MKNLFLKNKFQTRKVTMWQRNKLIQKIIVSLFFLFFLFFSLNFFYNQSKGILASEEDSEEEEIDYEKLKCGREIPVGEAMEKTEELLEEITRELEKIEVNSYDLIEKQKEMEELAKNCSMENCTPKCETITIKGAAIVCIPKPCQGDPCPEKEKVEELFIEITNLNKEIQEAKDKIDKLINKSVEPLCIKENEDIRTNVEKARCKVDRLLPNPICLEWTLEKILSSDFLPDWLMKACPVITVQEAISRKLNLSRGEFDECYVHPEDVEYIILGESTGKYLLDCQRVEKENHPRYTKTEIEIKKEGEKIKIPVCTSPYNWFCCLDVP